MFPAANRIHTTRFIRFLDERTLSIARKDCINTQINDGTGEIDLKSENVWRARFLSPEFKVPKNYTE